MIRHNDSQDGLHRRLRRSTSCDLRPSGHVIIRINRFELREPTRLCHFDRRLCDFQMSYMHGALRTTIGGFSKPVARIAFLDVGNARRFWISIGGACMADSILV